MNVCTRGVSTSSQQELKGKVQDMRDGRSFITSNRWRIHFYCWMKKESGIWECCVKNQKKLLDRTLLISRDMQMILAGLRSLDSVSGSRYYGQLMEKIQAGSSELISGRDSILIDRSSWYKTSLAPKIATIQDAIENRHILEFDYYAPSGESKRSIEPYYVVFKWTS